ncbi:hypothetical protein HDU93_003651, partial [Gonapodya sp. JEL0774]
FAGFALMIGCLYAIQDVDAVLGSPFPQQIMQIFVDATGKEWATVLMTIVIAASICCIICAITANSRMMYAFARDAGFGHAVSKFFYWSHPETKLPLRTVWLGTGVGMVITTAGFGSSVALSAFASIGTIGLMTAYIIPTMVKAFIARDSFKQGHAPIMVGFIVTFTTLYWVLSARKWFKGPIIHVTEEEIAALEKDAVKKPEELGAAA